jgi:hypothetical protein
MLVDRYFDSVRDALISAAASADDSRFSIRATDLVAIASDQRARARFRYRFLQINDPDAKALVLDQLRLVMGALEGQSKKGEANVELVDRGAFAPAATVAAAVVGKIIIGGAIVSPFLLVPVIGAMILSAAGRDRFKRRSIAVSQQAKDISTLLENLKP